MHDDKAKKDEERLKKIEYKIAKERYFLIINKKRILLISFLISLIIFITSVIFLNEIGLLIVFMYPFFLIMFFWQLKQPCFEIFNLIGLFLFYLIGVIIGFFI